MKTCQTHGHNPPSRCPNCRIHKKRARKKAAQKGWETRRKNVTLKDPNHQHETNNLAEHGWLS